MATVMEVLFSVATFLIPVISVNADSVCGKYLCTGWTAHCCSFDPDQCCFYQFYTFWWFWGLWVLVFLMCASCGYLCRRRYVQRREVIIVQGQPQQVYGTAGPQVNQGFVEQPTGYSTLGVQKPPEYSDANGKPPAYTSVP